MKILAIGGSMREDSNTNKLVQKVAQAAQKEFEYIDLGKLEIKPCTGCLACMMNEGKCCIDDDMTALYDKMLDADAFVFGSPTYYLNVSGAVKNLIDRGIALNYRGIGPLKDPDMPWEGQRPLAGKPIVILVTAAGGGHEEALKILKTCVVDCYQTRLVAQLAEPVGMGDIDEMPEVVHRAIEAGKRLGKALKGS